MTGFDMEDIYKRFERDRFARMCKMKIDIIGEGFARTSMVVEDMHLNGVDICQGGAIFTLADLAFACASNSHGPVSVSIDVSTVFLNAARQGQKLVAEAREISLHKHIATYEMEVRDEKGSLIAKMTGTVYRRQ